MDFDTLKDRYDNGRITVTMLKLYVKKGVISVEDYKSITGDDYIV